MHHFIAPQHPNGPDEFDTWLETELSGHTFDYGIERLQLPDKLYVSALHVDLSLVQ